MPSLISLVFVAVFVAIVLGDAVTKSDTGCPQEWRPPNNTYWLGKRVYNPEFDWKQFVSPVNGNPGLNAVLPTPAATYVNWTDPSLIPAKCKDTISNTNNFFHYTLDPIDFQVFDVKYDDCNLGSWTFCRHPNATFTQNDMITAFGRLPVRMRQKIRHFMAVPVVSQYAYTWVGDAVIVVEQAEDMTTLIHEATHVLDSAFGSVSSSPAWQNTFTGLPQSKNDVPNCYSDYSWAENLAEFGILATYDYMTRSGGEHGLTQVNSQWWDLLEPVNYWTAKFKDTLAPKGSLCNETPLTSPPVSKTTTAFGPVSNEPPTCKDRPL